MEHIHLLVYTSELAQAPEEIDNILRDIIKISKINNVKNEISGLLFYHNSRFLQFIEGDKNSLELLMKNIARDPRHKNIIRIIDEPVYVRSFSGWSMDSFNLNNNDAISLAELNAIRDIYKQNFNVISNVLATFYKLMLDTYSSGQRPK